MAAYRRVNDSCHRQADCQEPGSAPEPYARQSSTGYLYLFCRFFRWIKIYIKPLDRSNASWAGQMYRLIQIPKLFRLWKNKLTYSDSILAAVYNGASGQSERATNLNICTSRQHWQMSGTPLAHGITIGPLTIAFSASGGKSNELPPKVPIYKISLSYDLS